MKTFRYFKRNPFYTVITVGGLSSAIALSLFLFFYSYHELSYDRFHSKSDKIYLLRMDYMSNGKVIFDMYPPTPVYDLLKNSYSGVQGVTRMYVEPEVVVKSGTDVFREGNLLKVDRDFFTLFDFKDLSGGAERFFDNPKSILISSRLANKYFPGQNAVGKTLSLPGKNEFVIAGVCDPPSNSSIQFDFVTATLPSDSITWRFSVVAPIYFSVNTPTDAHDLTSKLQTVMDKQYGAGSYRLEVVPLREQYFHDSLNYALHGDRRYTGIFVILGVVILLIAVANYVNMATAQVIYRSKEFGVRKVSGATRMRLVFQYVKESAWLVGFSIGLGILFVYLGNGMLTTLAGKSIPIFALYPAAMGGLVVCLFIGLTSLSAFYPAIRISRMQPALAMRDLVTNHGRSTGIVRKGLVVFQFAVSVTFIILTMVMRTQVNFLVNQKLGFEKDQVLRIEVPWAVSKEVARSYSVLKENLLMESGISGVTVCPMPGYDFSFEGTYKIGNESKSTNAYIYFVDEDFLRVMGVTLLSGRNFDSGSTDQGVIINETAAELFFEGDPIGQQNKMMSKGTVIGVVRDFRFEGMKGSVLPLILRHYTTSFGSIQVKLKGDGIREAISKIQGIWKAQLPDQVFAYSFLDDDYDRLYQSETRIANLFSVFCFASIVIACTGLIGMASYTLVNLRRNLSIRKVFGASSANLFRWLLGQFMKPVALSIVLAVPVAWWLLTLYLEGFAYPITPGWELISLAVSIMVALVCVSVGVQAFNAARKNPITYLRGE